jgi:HEAT repeat protein
MMRALASWLPGAACVLLVWLLLLLCESLVVAIAALDLFAGAWEITAMRRFVLPIAFAALVPAALIVVAGAEVLARTPDQRAARAASGTAFAIASGAVAYGVSYGRHFASFAVRAAFVAGAVAVGAALGGALAPRLVAWARARAHGPATVVSIAAVVTALAWSADRWILPRLYPAFHVALFAITLLSAALLAWPLRTSLERRPRVEIAVTCVALIASVLAMVWAPRAAVRLARSDNVRIVLVENAPLLGRAIELASVLAPPPAPEVEDSSPRPSEVARALDWTRAGRDVVLLSVDALRADHVSAYGYARKTTPNLDALAREGMLFRWAYCPTPHTSYSITSMMTGKYMRPLLALGLGEDSETWASSLRRYGYRTAAFYPPAVFFIDAPRFGALRDRALDFEYAKVEFASAAARVDQVSAYLSSAPKDKPLFLWVHLFEPHEPYVSDPAHVFRSGSSDETDVDRYDSEIASADDGIGRILRLVRKDRPGATVIVTADHGEEFGEHGGRYHGTTVYEEQVRVPLVIAGAGVVHRESSVVVQTIDLLPTVLSALGIPRPARLRGRDLGPVLHADSDAPKDSGLAFAETDDYALLAEGDLRLVCARKAAACATYRPKSDPLERRDVSREAPAGASDAMRARLHAIERDQGRFERSQSSDDAFPESLRRGMQGEVDAAPEVASLLDDARAPIRRKAAKVTFDLHAPSVAPQVRRSFAREEDDETRRWSALALVRMGEPPTPLAEQLLHDPAAPWRRASALAFATQGDGRGEGELAAWWAAEGPPRGAMEFDRARDLLAALGRVKAKDAVPSLLRSLEDVRLRAHVADALGAIGDPSARRELLEVFARERYVTTRPHEARALMALGAKGELLEPLARFAGMPEPMSEAIAIARDAGLLAPLTGGVSRRPAASALDVTLTLAPTTRPRRLLVLTARPDDGGARTSGDGTGGGDGGGGGQGAAGGTLSGTIAGGPLPPPRDDGALHVFELGLVDGSSVRLSLTAPDGILAAWIVARADEIPPPPPAPWPRPDASVAAP